jgi:uncharacterized protein YerC
MESKKVTPEVAMRRLHERGNTITEIAELYSLSESKVKSILKINDMPNNTRKLTQAQKNKVIKLKKQGVTHREIERITGVSLSSVSRIINNTKRSTKTSTKEVKPAIAKQVKPKSSGIKSKFSLFWGALEIVKEKV